MLTNYVTGLFLAVEINRDRKGCSSSSAVISPELWSNRNTRIIL